MTFHRFYERDGAFFAAADAFQRAFGQIPIFDLFQVVEDGFPDVEGLGAPRAPGELLEALLDGLWQSNRQHKYLSPLTAAKGTPSCYTSIAQPRPGIACDIGRKVAP